MKPGSIDVNIMVKLDRIHYDEFGNPIGDDFTDAKAALRGFANSQLHSGIVLSAGMNRRLFSYIEKFKCFYRDACGDIEKKIILKVSDFRSALVQSKLLAKRGLEVSEYRVESGLNCGGHAFPSQGQIIPWILKEFKEKWSQLTDELQPFIQEHYRKENPGACVDALVLSPRLTVQGGIGTNGEHRRLMEEFGADRTGWGSPFLLVPEVTNVDDTTRELLKNAKEDDVYLSDISPINVPFNTVRGTGSERWTQQRVTDKKFGSPCPKGFAVTNTEFTERPICVASQQYQRAKLNDIDNMPIRNAEKDRLRQEVIIKTCICDHLGNGILIKLGLINESNAPQAICPGPNIAWFDRIYSLEEMVKHIYGLCPSLVPAHRPHMFAKEIEMNVDYFETLTKKSGRDARDAESLLEFKINLENGMEYCLEIAKKKPFPQENLESIVPCVQKQRLRLNSIHSAYLAQLAACCESTTIQ